MIEVEDSPTETVRTNFSNAFLVCDHCEKWTRHVFCKQRDTLDRLFIEDVYRCSMCGTERIWGMGYRAHHKADRKMASKYRRAAGCASRIKISSAE